MTLTDFVTFLEKLHSLNAKDSLHYYYITFFLIITFFVKKCYHAYFGIKQSG